MRTALVTVPMALKKALLRTDPSVLAEWDHYVPYLRADVATLSRSAIKSTAYVVDTLGAALWCTAKADTIQAAIVLAANLGGDTDTIATITATWAAIRYPQQSIPKSWQAALLNPDRLATYIEPFIAKYGAEEKSPAKINK